MASVARSGRQAGLLRESRDGSATPIGIATDGSARQAPHMAVSALLAVSLGVYTPYLDTHATNIKMSAHGRTVRASKTSRPLIVSPSVAKADQMNLGADLKAATDAGAEWLHFSVQDGRFVPKVSFGSPVVSAARKAFPDAVLDVKLGVWRPEDRVAEFVKAGADVISVHPETTMQLAAVLGRIEEAGCAPGVVLNPATPLDSVEHVLGGVDVVVVMLVNPGWGGPKYLDLACRKIRAVKDLCAELGVPTPHIEVDGGVNKANAPELIAAGANVLVAGGSVFSAADPAIAIKELIGGDCPSDMEMANV